MAKTSSPKGGNGPVKQVSVKQMLGMTTEHPSPDEMMNTGGSGMGGMRGHAPGMPDKGKKKG